jgi:hypothetical protein
VTVEKAELDQKLATAQLQRTELDNQRLAMELEKLRKSAPWYQIPLQFVPLVTAFVSVAGFLWGINLYMETQKNNSDASQKQALQREAQAKQENLNAERDFMQPWLKSQRDIYEEALDAAATASTSRDPKLRESATDAFWHLYYGRMVLVETTAVSGAMQDMSVCLRVKGVCTDKQKTDRTLKLGSAMAQSMAVTAKMSYDEFAKNQFLYGRPVVPLAVK